MQKLIILLLSLIVEGFVYAQTVTPTPQKPAPLILISFDGFRWDYVEKTTTPHFQKLVKEGGRSKSLTPVFPTKTFPNHYTIVTGLYPAHHGIVSNRFYDNDLKDAFTYRDSNDNRDPKWWLGEPIWITAEKQGVRTGCFFWPGSEVEHHGVRPRFWKKYNRSFADEARVDSAIAWLALPEEQRPSFITLYFSILDEIGHDLGPDSPEMIAAIQHSDSLIGRLMAGFGANGLDEKVNIVIVSDHGMTQISADSVIFLDDYVDEKTILAQMETPIIGLRALDGNHEELFLKLDGKHPKMKVFRKKDIPSHYHFDNSPRVAEVYCLADDGWSIGTHPYYNRDKSYYNGGSHGYLPETKNMGGIFIVNGPYFKQGYTGESFESVHIYNLICRALGIKSNANDGDSKVLEGYIKR